MGLQGDITIDVLIDATVSYNHKPLSGPVPSTTGRHGRATTVELRAGRDLGDQPVSTHLSVTVKFRLN